MLKGPEIPTRQKQPISGRSGEDAVCWLGLGGQAWGSTPLSHHHLEHWVPVPLIHCLFLAHSLSLPAVWRMEHLEITGAPIGNQSSCRGVGGGGRKRIQAVSFLPRDVPARHCSERFRRSGRKLLVPPQGGMDAPPMEDGCLATCPQPDPTPKEPVCSSVFFYPLHTPVSVCPGFSPQTHTACRSGVQKATGNGKKEMFG